MKQSFYWWAEATLQDLIHRLDETGYLVYSELQIKLGHDEHCPCYKWVSEQVTFDQVNEACICDVHLKVDLNPWTSVVLRAPRTHEDATREEVIQHLEKMDVETLPSPSPNLH